MLSQENYTKTCSTIAQVMPNALQKENTRAEPQNTWLESKAVQAKPATPKYNVSKHKCNVQPIEA